MVRVYSVVTVDGKPVLRVRAKGNHAVQMRCIDGTLQSGAAFNAQTQRTVVGQAAERTRG